MATDEMIIDSDRFVMLDFVNTIGENKTTKGYPIVQIVSPLSKSTYQSIEAIKNRIGRDLKFEEKREDLFTITLNVDADYKIQLFR